MKRKRSKPVPLAPPALKSRKRARKLTTDFHRLTRQIDHARGDNDKVAVLNHMIDEMGGRVEYQRASQVSTSFFSTSKWVLGVLHRNGWAYGISPDQGTRPRRSTRVLEIGAINTELLDAAKKTQYKLQVRSIDLHSLHEGIEEMDFLQMSVEKDVHRRYDAVVCSMILNCVPCPKDRGEMLARLHHFLRPGGLVFLTIPKSCLTLSPYMDHAGFMKLLKAVGLEMVESKETPRIAFFICRRGLREAKVDSESHDIQTIRRGKKFKNDFSIVLTRKAIEGSDLTYIVT